jgi:hypothetical protein
MPRYDIGQVLEKKKPEAFRNLSVGHEEPFLASAKKGPAHWWERDILLYGLMGLIILMLGWFSLSMIRHKK